MAAASSSTITLPLTPNPSTKLNHLSSSSSVFFSYNIKNLAGLGLGLSLDQPIRGQKRGFSCNCLFGLGVPELVVIVGVSALVFGPTKLPEVGRSIGKTVKGFQQAAKEFETELKKDAEASSEASSVAAVEEQQQEAA